jgi:hypothetical protein
MALDLNFLYILTLQLKMDNGHISISSQYCPMKKANSGKIGEVGKTI